MVAVACGRLSFIRGSSIKLWLRAFMVFWEGGRLWEVVAGRGSTVLMKHWYHPVPCINLALPRLLSPPTPPPPPNMLSINKSTAGETSERICSICCYYTRLDNLLSALIKCPSSLVRYVPLYFCQHRAGKGNPLRCSMFSTDLLQSRQIN